MQGASDVIDPEVVDSSGYRIRQRDLDFLKITLVAVNDWYKRRSPLGMAPDSYQRFLGDLFTALENLSLHDTDVRLQGSSAWFFSGQHKTFPHTPVGWKREFIASWRRQPSTTDLAAIAELYNGWFGDEDRPFQRPFDSLFRLAIHRDKSDIDVQLSSLTIAESVRSGWTELVDSGYGPGPLVHPKYGFLNKNAVEFSCPELIEWSERYTALFDRLVTIACFDEGGPSRRSRGVSSHFRDNDWRIQLPLEAR